MNETLKQIAIEAKVEHCISHVRLKEFAELIVKECCTIADNTVVGLPSDEILEHFGVKE